MAVYRYRDYEPQIGSDCYVSDSARVIGNVILGDRCYVGHGAIIRADHGKIDIGEGTAVEEGVIIHVRFEKSYMIAQRVTIAHGAVLHGDRIKANAIIGMGSVVGRETVIGQWALVAEGCVVPRGAQVEDESVVAGIPAKKLGTIRAEQKQYWQWAKDKYEQYAGNYQKDLVRLF